MRSRRCRTMIFVCRSQLAHIAKSSTRAASSDRRICAFESARPDGRLSRTNRSLEALTRSRELSAQNALVWIRGFRVFRLFLARVPVRWFSFFSLHLFTYLLQRNDCQRVWCEGFCISPSHYASLSRSPPIRTKSLLFCETRFKSSGVPNRNGRR